jgi:hypothetical protein
VLNDAVTLQAAKSALKGADPFVGGEDVTSRRVKSLRNTLARLIRARSRPPGTSHPGVTPRPRPWRG